MPLESATYISQLNASNPTGADPKSEGDDHLRLAKATLRNTFQNFTAAPLLSTQAQIDGLTSTITPAGGNIGVGGSPGAGERVAVITPSGTRTVLRLGQTAVRDWYWSIPASSPNLVLTDATSGTDLMSVTPAGVFTFAGSLAASGGLTAANITLTGAPLNLAYGGTSASTAAGARTNLGLGSAATANTGDFVSATGGTYAGTFNFSGPLQYAGIEVGFRGVPRVTSFTGSNGKCWATSAGFTFNTTDGLTGQAVSVYNDSASAISIAQGAGMTLRLAGTTLTGTRTLAPRGLATFWWNSATEIIGSGAGLT